jgi:hypothetical protein
MGIQQVLPGITGSEKKKKKKNPAAILMPCVKPSGMGFSGMGVLHITLASPQGPFK